MSSPASTVEFLDLVRKSGLIRAESLDRHLADTGGLPADPVQSAAVLVREGLLTKFQAKLLLTGRYRGFKMGPYTVKEQIGQGGMGAVYLGEHDTLRRRVALKVLAHGALGDKLAVERFLREARAAAALDHPNIVRIHDVGNQTGTHYLVMEYVVGQTLEAMLHGGGPMACGRAVDYITQAAAGLQHAYEKGFIHRDIKPANLMVTEDGTVKLLDMGLARSQEQSDKLTEQLDQGSVVGTADFIAPEQAINSPNIDIRADIYSLGATFFTLVTGRPPFEGSTTQKLLQHQMKSAPTITGIDKTFPPGLSAVVAKMLAKKPEDRYATPGDVIDALAPWLPDSAAMKVVAGLSSTEIGRTDRLNTVRNTATLSQSTGVLANRNKPVNSRGQKIAMVAASAVAFVALSGAVAVGLDLGSGKKSDDATATNPAPVAANKEADKAKQPAAPKTTPPANAAPAANPPAPVAKRTEAGLQVFHFAPGTENFKQTVVDSKSVNDFRPKLPTGIATQCWKKETEGEFRGEAINGVRALTVENRSGPASAQVAFDLEGAIGVKLEPGRDYTIRVTHLSKSNADGRLTVQDPAYKSVASRALPATNGAWQATELQVRRGPDVPLRFTVAASTVGPNSAVSIRSVEVFEAFSPTATGKVQYQLDLSSQKPFNEVGNSVLPANAKSKKWVASVRTGDGKLPAGWAGYPHNLETKAEYAAREVDGSKAIGMRILSGPASGMLFTPTVSTPGGRCRLTFDYKSDFTGGDLTIRFRPLTPTPGPAYDIRGQAGSTQWATAIMDIDLKGATSGIFEIHTRKTDIDKWVWIRALSVTELASVRAAGQPAYTADFAKMQPVSKTIAPMEKITSSAEIAGQKLPASVSVNHFRNTAGGVYTIGNVHGARALGLQQTIGAVGVQMTCKCDSMLSKLAPGESAIVRLTYNFEGKGLGHAGIQYTKAPYYKIAVAELRPTGPQWATVEIPFTRPVEGENYDLIFNTGMDRIIEKPADGTIWFKSIEAVPAGASAAPSEPVIFRLNAADVKPFRVTKTGRKANDGSADAAPKGMYFGGHKSDTANEWVSGPIDGVSALGFTTLSGPVSTQIGVELESETGINAKLTPGKFYRLRITYTTSGKARGTAYFQDYATFKTYSGIKLPNSNADWRTVETIVERKDLPLRFLVDNNETGADNMLYVREIAVTEVQETSSVPAVAVALKKPDGPKLFALAFTGLTPFKETMMNKAFATAPPLPKGVAAQCGKAESVAEFRAEEIRGASALGITNLNDPISGQFVVELEKDFGVKLEAGKTYRARVEYLTRNDATGKLSVRGDGTQVVTTAPMGTTSDVWKTADVTFTRPAGPVSIAFENGTVGEGNTLYVRNLEVFALE